MAEEPRTALAALFKMRGRDTMTESEFVLDASMKLRWFSPKDAQLLLQNGIDQGLLRTEVGNVRPTFDPSIVDVPVNYRPGPEAFAPPAKPAGLFARIVERVRMATGEEAPPVVASINEVQERLSVEAEVAAACVAASRGVDVSDLLPEIEAEVLRRAG